MTGSEATVLVVDDDPAMAAAYANCSGNPVTARLAQTRGRRLSISLSAINRTC
jgi:hypothetical protein